jgi:circadian clock protein KaiB
MKKANSQQIKATTEAFEMTLIRPQNETKYLLRLYITGSTPRSTQAVANIKLICEQNLKGQYELEVIDLYLKPNLAKGEQILAAPTLIKELPLPLRRIIGDMSDVDRVLVGLDLRKLTEIES